VSSALVIIIATLAIALFLGVRARRGRTMSLEQWSVGGRGFGTIFVFLLMAGEIAILAIGGFVLWLVGEFGDAPKWLRSRTLRKGRRAQ